MHCCCGTERFLYYWTHKVVVDLLRVFADFLRDGSPKHRVGRVEGGRLLRGVGGVEGHRVPPLDSGGFHGLDVCPNNKNEDIRMTLSDKTREDSFHGEMLERMRND